MPTSNFPLSESNLSIRTLSSYAESFELLTKDGRKSCEFTNISSSCINKATTNLNRLKSGLEQWRKETVNLETSRKVLKEEHLSKLNISRLSSTPKQKLEAINSGTTLEVYDERDISLQISKIETQVAIPSNENGCARYKKMVEGLHHLLSRLEKDRSDMEVLLEKERRRTFALRDRIDSYAYRRIKELPKAVQNEHEKCAYDVQELKWHCAYKGRAEARIKEKVRIAGTMNKKIKEEILFVKENSPLIEGKLDLEKNTMLVIKEKQTKVSDELCEANKVLGEVKEEFEELKKQAEIEQKMLAAKLLSLSNELTLSLRSLLNTQNDLEKMIALMYDLQQKLTDMMEQISLADKTIAKVQSDERYLEKQLADLDDKIEFQIDEHDKLLKEIERCKEDQMSKEQNLERMRKVNNATILEKSKFLQKLVTGNKTSDKEIASLKRRIDMCDKQKISDAKAVKRALLETQKVQADLQIIKEETDHTRTIHDKLLLKLDQERGKAAEIEENLSLTCEALKKQVKEESRARTILQARINADTEDFSKKRNDSETKRVKMLQTDDGIEKVNATVSSQVDKLNLKYEERMKAIDGLSRLLQQIIDKHKETEISLTNEINLLEPKEQNLKLELLNICSRQDEMDQTSAQLDKKLCDMASSSVMMNKLLLSNQNAIDDLNDELNELQIQLDSGQGLESKLRDSLLETKDRSCLQRNIHSNQLMCRQNTLVTSKDILATSLDKNKKLASKYIEFQTEHINEKNLFVNTYEKSVLAQETLKDKKNLCELHARLHEALKCYYHLRGVQTKVGLKHFNEMTKKSNKKLENIQDQLEVSLTNITSFLEANNKSHRTVQLQAFHKNPLLKVVS